MKLEDITAEVERIKSISDNDEAAHGAEDMLRWQFIAYVAECEHPELSNMAKEILKTDDIEFERWCS